MKTLLLAATFLVAFSHVTSAHPRNSSTDYARHAAARQTHVSETPRVIAIAKRDLGRNPTGWNRLWCARWLNMIEKKAGRPGTSSAMAKSFARYGRRIPLKAARPGDIVVTKRRGGHHVGYLLAKKKGTVKLISGNSGGRGPGRRVVAIGTYPTSRIVSVTRVTKGRQFSQLSR